MSSEPPKAIFVTGAASGIGKYLANSFADRGDRVFCTDIDLASMHTWVEDRGEAPGTIVTRRLDVRRPEDWKEAVDEAVRTFGRIDVLLNVAGYLRPGYVAEVSTEDVDMHFDVNAKGVVYGTREAAKTMVERGCGHIINVGSLASLTPVPGLSLYGASKFAVRGFSLSAAEELRPRGVDVSVVLLDAVRTPMLDRQAGFEEAALTFSGPRPLELEEVEALIDDVMARRPLEVTLPRQRGLVARLAGFVPDISRLVAPLLRRRGEQAQSEYESSR